MPTVQKILDSKGSAVFKIDDQASVLEAAELMNARRVGALVVTHDDNVVGIFTERDVLNRVVAKQLDAASSVVASVMTSPIACCTPQTTRSECRSVMKSRRIRHLPVVSEGRLLGIVSIGDIVEDEGAEQEETIRYLYEYMHGEWR